MDSQTTMVTHDTIFSFPSWDQTLLGSIPHDLHPLVSRFFKTFLWADRAAFKQAYQDKGSFGLNILRGIRGIGIEPKTGHLFITDRTNNLATMFDDEEDYSHRIHVFEAHPPYSPLRVFGDFGEEDAEFDHPSGMAFDVDGNLILADSANHRLQILEPSGKFVSKFGQLGKQLGGRFHRPFGVAVGCEGEIIVADTQNNRIQVLSSKGDFLRTFGSTGTEPGQLSSPVGVAVDPTNGNIVVTDAENRRIQIFDEMGNWIRILAAHRHFDYPTGVLVDRDGKIGVLDQEGLYLFSRSEDRLLFEKRKPSPGRRLLSSMTMDREGTIFVTNPWDNQVEVLGD